MNIFISNKKEVKLKDFIVFASLPDIGKVGGLVTEFLIKELKAEKISEIKIFEKPWVNHNDGIINQIPELYNVYLNQANNLILFTGSTQPQEPVNLYNLCISLINILDKIGKPRRLYTSGGYHQPNLVEAPKVYAVSNNIKMKTLLDKNKIDALDNKIQIITWFNGVIMGIAKERDIDSIGLFGEIANTEINNPLAAKAIVKVFSQLENININTEQLDRDYEKQVLQNLRDTKSNVKKKDGPGIG